MAPQKRTPRQSMSTPADADRGLPVVLGREGDSPGRQEALLSHATPGETQISTDWVSRMKEEKKAQRKEDLKKADRIIKARLAGHRVTVEELAWVQKIGAEEEALEKAENEAKARAAAASAESREEGSYSDMDMWDDDIGGLQRGPNSALLTARNPRNTGVTAQSSTGLDDDSSDSSSDLSSVVSDVSALNPNPRRTRRQKGKQKASTAHPRHQGDASVQNNSVEPEAVADPQKALLANALATLQYDDNPPDRPHWLTGLRKPLPHPDLTAQQDFEVQTRFWVDEIARLQHLRAQLATPAGVAGEWLYEHFGSTIEVSKRTGGRSKVVLARGIWRHVVEDEEVEVQLDEYPMTLEGEPLGWGTTRELSEFEVEWEDSAGEEEGGGSKEAGGEVQELRREEEDVMEMQGLSLGDHEVITIDDDDDEDAWEDVDSNEDL